jgi:hypothetical protein
MVAIGCLLPVLTLVAGGAIGFAIGGATAPLWGGGVGFVIGLGLMVMLLFGFERLRGG